MNQIYFHIGFHKTGSTWLQKKVFTSNNGFNLLNDFVTPWKDPIIKYLVYTEFDKFKPSKLNVLVKNKYRENQINIISAERLSGHPLSDHLDTKIIAKKISLSFPNAFIIIVTRDLNSFINSTYKQVVKRGYPENFKKYLLRYNSSNDKKFYFNNENTVKYYKNIFGNNNILELKFDDFKNEKDHFLNALSDFLNITSSLKIKEKNEIINKTFSNRRIRSIQFLNLLTNSKFKSNSKRRSFKKLIFIISILISVFFNNKSFHK